jgi:O-antigen ligase
MTEIAAQPVKSGKWGRVMLVLTVGYCLMGRSFAYLGIPPWHIFIGEVALAAFLLAGPETVRGPWTRLAPRIKKLRGLAKIYLLFLAYGVFQVVHGIALGYPALTAVRDLAFNYYPLFFLLGLWVGLQKQDFLPRLFRILAWLNGIYGLAYILLLSRVDWTFPGVSNQVVPVPIFGLPEFSFVILLALLMYEPDLKSVWHLLVINAFVLLGMQIRGEWLGLAVGLFLWGALTKRLKRMLAGGGVILLLLVLMFLVNFRIPGPETRGDTEISARDLAGRALAPVNSDLAGEYTSSYKMDVGTAVWRTIWWVAIWQEVNQSRKTALFGFGYGYPLGELSPLIEQGEFIQTPHNVFFYALGYSGWIGVLLLVLFQAGIVRLLWQAYRKAGQPAGLVLWFAMLAFALFTPFFEVPQGGIPFFLILGCAAGASFSLKPANAKSAAELAVK